MSHTYGAIQHPVEVSGHDDDGDFIVAWEILDIALKILIDTDTMLWCEAKKCQNLAEFI